MNKVFVLISVILINITILFAEGFTAEDIMFYKKNYKIPPVSKI